MLHIWVTPSTADFFCIYNIYPTEKKVYSSDCLIVLYDRSAWVCEWLTICLLSALWNLLESFFLDQKSPFTLQKGLRLHLCKDDAKYLVSVTFPRWLVTTAFELSWTVWGSNLNPGEVKYLIKIMWQVSTREDSWEFQVLFFQYTCWQKRCIQGIKHRFGHHIRINYLLDTSR